MNIAFLLFPNVTQLDLTGPAQVLSRLGGGPRTCVGARFATTEALAILAHWLDRWRFAPMPGRAVQPSGMVTLRPKGGLPLRLERRG